MTAHQVRGRPAGETDPGGPRTAAGSSLRTGALAASHGDDRGRRQPRSWGLVSAAALCVICSAVGVATWGARAGDKSPVLALVHDVPAGSTLQRADLVAVQVAGVPAAVPAADINTVVGRVATTTLVADQLLLPAALASTPLPGAGQAVVGLDLGPGRMPATGLQPGDVADVIAVPAADDASATSVVATELAPSALVLGVDAGGVSGGTLVTVVVDQGLAAELTAYAAQGRVALYETAP